MTDDNDVKNASENVDEPKSTEEAAPPEKVLETQEPDSVEEELVENKSAGADVPKENNENDFNCDDAAKNPAENPAPAYDDAGRAHEEDNDGAANADGSTKMKGTCKWFNSSKGYGFIEGSDGKDYFVHQTAIKADGFRSLGEGEEVEFIATEENGKTKALDVTGPDGANVKGDGGPVQGGGGRGRGRGGRGGYGNYGGGGGGYNNYGGGGGGFGGGFGGSGGYGGGYGGFGGRGGGYGGGYGGSGAGGSYGGTFGSGAGAYGGYSAFGGSGGGGFSGGSFSGY